MKYEKRNELKKKKKENEKIVAQRLLYVGEE